MAWQFDWDYRFYPKWNPPGSPVQPWFLWGKNGELPPTPTDPATYWDFALQYRARKIAFVREQLRGVDREAALREIMARVWQGAKNVRERYERLIHFVQQMMVHPPQEQPIESDGVQSLRRECCAATDQAPAYEEDLERPFAQ